MFDYKERQPGSDFQSQLEFLRAHDVDDPEKWVKEYGFISNNVRCFRHLLDDEFNQYYRNRVPGAQIKGLSVRGNTTTNFFIVMTKGWWSHIEKMFDGDLQRYMEYQGGRMTFC